MSIKGVDIASHQGPNFPFGSPYQFAIIKASGGHNYRNEYLPEQVRGARNAGLATGFYHYMFEPSVGGGNVKREAVNFIEAVRPYAQPGVSFWLDVEEYPNTVGFTGDLGGWIVEFCEAVEAAYGCVCGIYCATWYLVPTGLSKDARLTKYPFWVASWQEQPPAPHFLAPWTTWTLWQYNADGVDKNLFAGTLEEFKALGVPATAPPQSGNEISAFILPDGRPGFTVIFAGQAKQVLGADIADAGISVVGMNNLIHDQSVQGNGFNGWRVR